MPLSCSYCGCLGHNITRCDNPVVNILNNNMRNIFINIIQQNLPLTVSEQLFVNTVCRRFNSSDLKVVSIRNTTVRANSRKIEFALSLWAYYFTNNSINVINVNVININENENENENVNENENENVNENVINDIANWVEINHTSTTHTNENRLPVVADEIPSYAIDIDIDIDIDTHHNGNEENVNVFELEDYTYATPTRINRQNSNVGESNRIRLERRNSNMYIPLEDEFIPFSTNLDQDFESVEDIVKNVIRKFYISPILVCQETDEELEEAFECPVCYESIKNINSITLNCCHKFCEGCIKGILNTHNSIRGVPGPGCALCRERMTTFVVKNDTLLDSISEYCS